MLLIGKRTPDYSGQGQPAGDDSSGCGLLGLFAPGPSYSGDGQPPPRCAGGLVGMLFPTPPVYRRAEPVALPAPDPSRLPCGCWPGQE
jgi:hypothetical protein